MTFIPLPARWTATNANHHFRHKSSLLIVSTSTSWVRRLSIITPLPPMVTHLLLFRGRVILDESKTTNQPGITPSWPPTPGLSWTGPRFVHRLLAGSGQSAGSMVQLVPWRQSPVPATFYPVPHYRPLRLLPVRSYAGVISHRALHVCSDICIIS